MQIMPASTGVPQQTIRRSHFTAPTTVLRSSPQDSPTTGNCHFAPMPPQGSIRHPLAVAGLVADCTRDKPVLPYFAPVSCRHETFIFFHTSLPPAPSGPWQLSSPHGVSEWSHLQSILPAAIVPGVCFRRSSAVRAGVPVLRHVSLSTIRPRLHYRALYLLAPLALPTLAPSFWHQYLWILLTAFSLRWRATGA